MGNLTVYKDKALGMLMDYAPKLVLAIVVLFVGMRLIKVACNLAARFFQKKDYDKSLENYLLSMLRIALKVVLFVMVIQMIGVQTTSLVAILGAAGLAVGLALQGSLANFAGGVLLLIFKPFKVGDFIRAQNLEGAVQSIQVFATELITLDGKKVIIPNGPLSNGPIENFTSQPARKVSFEFGIGYSDDIDKAKAAVEEIITADDRILKDPKHLIAVTTHGDNSVGLGVYVWCTPDKYWDIHFSYPEKVKKAFDAKGIEIPFPQMVVHKAS